MTDISTTSSSSTASPSSSSPALAADLTRSSSTPPELDSLSSTNVFAFGLHSSYGAFANEPSSSLPSLPSSSQPTSPPPSNTSNGATANLVALSSMQHQMNMMHLGMMPMPGMDSSTSSSSPSSSLLPTPSIDSSKPPWQPPSHPSLDFSHLSLSQSSSLLTLNNPTLPPPFPSTFLFNNQPSPSSSSTTSSHSPLTSHPSDLSTASDPSLSTLPLDFNPYLYLQGVPQMSVAGSAFDPFALNMFMQPQGGRGGGMNPSVCKFYASGHCARGENCSYAHLRADGTSAVTAAMRGGFIGGMMRGRGRGDNRMGSRDGFREGNRGGRGGMRGGVSGPFRGRMNNQPFHPSMMQKDGGLQHSSMPTASNPLSPLSPSLMALNPLADPSLLLHSPPFAPLDYPLFSPYPTPSDFFDSSLTLGLPSSPDELAGRVYNLAKDQYGCRLLQRLLDEQRPGLLDCIYQETSPHITELMTDPFGNYLVQKLLEHCSDVQRQQILQKVASELVAISLNLHGTRAVQKLVETLTTPVEVESLVNALKGSVVTLIKDLNGNHVIQRCLHHLSSKDNQFIYDAVCRHCVSVSTHKHGCCVLQRCIDYATVGQKRQIINEICTNALELVQDAYGNYVVQYVLDLNDPTSTSHIVTSLAGHVSSLSVQKFSSNVIEKCIAADTLISTIQGLSHRIQHIKTGTALMCKQGEGIGVGEQSRLLERGVKETVVVEMEDGRTLRCTADHLMMTTEGWRRVEEMEVEKTEVVIGLEGVEDKTDELEDAFVIDLPDLSIGMKEERQRCLALMRLAGFRCSHSTLKECLTVRHIHDRLCLTEDVELVTGEDCEFRLTSDGGWEVEVPTILSSSTLLLLMRYLQLRYCPASLRREFLAGCYGACGSLHLQNMSATFSLPLSQHPILYASLLPLLPLLLTALHVADGQVRWCDFTRSVLVSVDASELLSFVDCVGSRYNVEQSYILSVASSFLCHVQRSSPPLTFSAYCERIGCSEWFKPSSQSFCSASLPKFHLRVSSIRPSSPSPTYDLTVDHSHSFLANGLLVHNCLELANDKLRARLVDELVNPERLPRLLQDPYANYVLQKALSVSKKQQLDRLVAVIKPHLPQLKHTTFGKRIQNKISKKFPDLDIDTYLAEGAAMQGGGGMAAVGTPVVGGSISSLSGGIHDPTGYQTPSSSPSPPLISPSNRLIGLSIGSVGGLGSSTSTGDLPPGLSALNDSIANLSLNTSGGSGFSSFVDSGTVGVEGEQSSLFSSSIPTEQ